MIRTFETHKVREVRELSSGLWDFHTLPEVGEGEYRRVMVPSCWETYPGLENYRGKASYSTAFEGEGNVRIECKGVSHTADVYVDGVKRAHHYNAFTPFDLVIRDLAPGAHTLEIIADNSFGPDSALHIENDYACYGGINRGVVLEELGDAYIQWIHFTPVKKKSGWGGSGEIALQNLCDGDYSGTLKLYLRSCMAGSENIEVGTKEISLKAQECCVVKLPDILCEGVEEWMPETPRLYYLTAELETVCDGEALVEDDLIERIGFREVFVQGKDILLNGRKLRIKGFCRHEDHPMFGCALPAEAIWNDLMIAKDLGANSIRTSHYPNDEIFLDLCDEQGILVWEENHARGLSEERMRNPNFEPQAEACIREMITAHFNHPSIYIWGILNECASHTQYGYECYKAQLELIAQMDPSRPTSFSSCQFKTDICFGLPTVVSYNIYPKWYHDTPVAEYLSDLYNWVQEETEGAGKPFLITEIGAGAIYGYRTPAHVKWSEEYQADALEEQISAVLAQPGCSGIYVWQFCDVRICDSWWNTRPRTMNNKGIVDEYRRPKLSYSIVKKLYSEVENYRD